MPKISKRPKTSKMIVLKDCPVCDRKGMNSQAYSKHSKRHLNIVFNCFHCTKQFANKDSLRKHLTACKVVEVISTANVITVVDKPADVLDPIPSTSATVVDVKLSELSGTAMVVPFDMSIAAVVPAKEFVVFERGVNYCIKCAKTYDTMEVLILHMIDVHCPAVRNYCVPCEKMLDNAETHAIHGVCHYGDCFQPIYEAIDRINLGNPHTKKSDSERDEGDDVYVSSTEVEYDDWSDSDSDGSSDTVVSGRLVGVTERIVSSDEVREAESQLEMYKT